MLPLEARKFLGEVVETGYMYGGYRMKVIWEVGTDRAQVSVYDLGERWPLRWTKTVTKSQARGAIRAFEKIGYFDLWVQEKGEKANMDARKFVMNLYNFDDGTNVLHDIESAAEDLGYMGFIGMEIPEGLTPERYADIWNELVCSDCEEVVLQDGKRVPRYTQMTDGQIARAIWDAPTWDSVEDLVAYVDREHLSLERDEDGYLADGWKQEVMDWCKKQ